ncbi:hypothetical protein CHS0354_008721 [Potamilus streckersoni]|uniref:BTB domain-containing protein n=1 Tax=Potamilus streckersoni TaxID=2493646 RepID=A0AAE0SBZ0_9BIVA|nr:hypothetical protein CHS0354_008721 [Potamilus streckersoni]
MEHEDGDNPDHPFNTEYEFSDVVLCVEGQKLFASKSLLALASPVFSCMFTSEFREKYEKEIHLPGKSYQTIEDLLRFMHPGIELKLSDDTAFRLLPLAEEYQIDLLKKNCEEHLVNRLETSTYTSVDFLIKCMEVSEKCRLQKLLELCMNKFETSNMQLRELDESGVSLMVKARIYKRRLERLETEREEAIIWKEMMDSVRIRLRDIVTPHDDHCRCRTEIKLRSTLQRICPYCARAWCSDNVSTESYRNSYWFFCNHKIGFHVTHDPVIRNFIEHGDISEP